MRKSTFTNLLIVLFALLYFNSLLGQNLVPFNPRYDEAIKGDILLIGNSNIGVHATNPYSGNSNNESSANRDDMVYVDIDNDNTTFNSSNANLDVPNDVNCYKIVYAGLYWSSVVKGNTSMANIKFKTPESAGYIDITGTEIYYQNSSNDRNSNTYAYYRDVTDILSTLTNPEGTYTVANISSMTSSMMTSGRNTEGLSAGWSLFVIYEDPLLPSKYITSFDGFTKIDNQAPNTQQSFTINGFRTIPTGPVRAKYAFSALEGDRGWTQDYLEINGTKISATNANGTTIRPYNNFFNSTVSVIDPITNSPMLFTDRNPASSNTLGFDAGIINIPNANNSLIANGDTSAVIRLGTNTDIYYFYFSAFAIEIIAPNIVLTKIVEDIQGNDIGGQVVDLGDELYYTIGFQNTGNDNATDLTIRDILPTNVVFNYPADIGLLPPGVSVQNYNPITRELVFRIDPSVVEENDPALEIRFKVTVVATCSLLSNACSNNIDNQAYATYKGTINPDFTISDDPSFSSNTGCLLTPGATNFLADLNGCNFEEEVILCGASTVLTAGSGYDEYSWSTSPTGTPVIGTTQSITVTNPGTYYVHNTAIAPCQSIDQVFNVITFGANVTNPVIPFADEVVECPNDGKKLPNIYLCGANDSRFIQTNITDTSSIIWEKLDESSCDAVTEKDCANEAIGCTWNQVATGPNFTADTAGQYRLTLNYTGGCFNQFYFNIYENLLVPTVTSRDIYCTTPGQITIGDVPSGYEFSIDGTNYQTSNVFSITAANVYSVYIRQIGVTPNPCIFTVPDVQIRQRNFTVSTIVTQPYCNGEKGSVVLAANNVRPQYFYSIYQGATLINSVGPINNSDYTFANLNPGTYTATVSTEDGCTETVNIEIINPPLLTATSALTKPLTCTDGEITVYPVGGTPPYYYFVNSTTEFQGTPIIEVTTTGIYNITVVDANNCSAETSITVDATPAPDFNVTKTDILCADAGNVGTINVNVVNANGNSLMYSIDNGVTFFNSPVFSELASGNYDVVIQYTIGTDVCVSTPQPITITTVAAINGIATLTTPYTCTTNGVITVSGVSGGTAPYTYSIDGVNYQTGLTFSGLVNGTYTVTIKDANDCTFATVPVTINPLNPPTDLSFSNTPLSCPSIISDVTVTATGGVGTLEYQIIAPAGAVTAYQTSNIFTGLEPNTYTFRVRDANACIYTESYTIEPLIPINLNTVLTKDLDCTASPDAIITGTFSGGVAPFTYAVSINGTAYSSLGVTGSPFSYPTSNDGTYQFQVTDANGCTAESSIQTVNAISLPNILSVVQTQPILCSGDNSAAIQITIDNTVGTPAFILNIYNDSTLTDYGTQTSGLTAGTYIITLTDSKSCIDTESIVIAEPTPINVLHHAVDISCDAVLGVSKGSVIVDGVTGGTAPYNYFVTGTNGYSASELNSSGTTSVTFDVVDFGLYEINVVDANGCSFLIQDVLVASPPDNLNIVIDTTVDCTSGGGEAEVSVGTALASAGPFFFSIYQGPTSVYPTGTWLPEDALNSKKATFTGLIPGVTYTFIVYDDATKCSYYQPATASIPTNTTLTATALTSNNITCVGSNDGNVSFTINNTYAGPVTVSYEIWDALSTTPTGISSTGNVINGGGTLPVVNFPGSPPGLSFGTYFVLITETVGPNAGCSVATVPFNITESAIDLSISATVDKNANCNTNSGVISAIARDGTAPYLYQITTTAAVPPPNNPLWASATTFNRDAGNYYVHVKDAYGCIKSTAVVVLPPDPSPVISATLNNQCTATEGNFTIDVALTTAGIAPYSYSIDGGAFQTRTVPFTISNLASGSHRVEVKDANGCGNLVTVEIVAPLSLIPTVTTLPTCHDDDGVLTITGSGGTGSYTYNISPNPLTASISGNIISGLPSGTYTVTITDDTTLCTKDISVFLPSTTLPTITIGSPTAVTCFADTNGTFEINVNGYSGPYNFEVFNSSGTSINGVVSANTSTNPLLVTGIPAGNYTVVVTETDSPFCSASSNVVTINTPLSPLFITASETSNVTCDDDKGTITAIATGGYGTYEYELTGSATIAYSASGTFRNLSAGNYTINVKDAGGCIVSEAVTLTIPTPIDATVTANTTLLSCFGESNATITANLVSGGEGSNYSYTLNMTSPTVTSSGPQASPSFSGLGVGTYNVTITDGYNCQYISPNIVISQPTQVQATLVKETSQTCLTGTTLRLSATGGTGVYEYSDSANFATILGSFTLSTPALITVAPGTHSYYVRDTNSCVADVSNQIKIDPLPTLVINLDKTNPTINCAGDSTGVIIAKAEGGLGNYIYTLQDGAGINIPGATQNSPGVFTELPAGTYQVRVDSGDCLSIEGPITITQPTTPLTASFDPTDITCPGTNNGRLEITASGGTGIIKYAISPRLDQFFETSTFINLTPGNYQAIAQDELGCFVINDFVINEPLLVELIIVPGSLVPEVCAGDMNGAFSIDISGGNMPYSVSLDDANGVYTTGAPAQTQFDFNGLIGGDHIVYVRDALGCETEWNITFPQSVTINPEVAVEFGCTNNVSTNLVTVTVDASNTNPADLDYSLNGNAFQASNEFVNVPAGLGHYIDVRHTNSCIQRTVSFDIEPYEPLALILENGGLNEIVAVTTGGSGNYEYSLNGESYGSTNTFIIYKSGDYTVTVTDSYGCFVSATKYYEFIDLCIPNYFTPNNDGVLDTWGPGCASQYKEIKVSIFDRYGRKVAILTIGQKWDGKYNGIELPTGDYWYVVKLNDKKYDREFVGHFTLYR
ncbi:T9SS type B sorting domain-containing protein [Mariniflexile litorale]|uniref:T9SS type B sorting domain-containing protein n=1 Tax=Mariniflexile litorale TaxID=3045158 RepID=A0AAU7EGF4_9FLAO|nr:T9SS type B sorting domain-containing protein [Mariniflexile sp. KMM 9835]MDQ8213198.1 T9SS type B sorting domain-containing protein [Mariniflexile sp. KMM 9835]